MSAATTQTRQAGSQAVCPRCGYDLRGEIQTWQDRCPMRGRCAECGLGFAWADVFYRRVHPWLFEHQWRRRPTSSFVATVCATLRPWRFWADVGMSHRVHLAPLLCVVLLSAALLFLMTWGAAVGTAGAQMSWSAAGSPTYGAPTYGVRDILADLRITIRLIQELSEYRFALVVSLVGMPFGFLLLGTTMRSAQVRFLHLVRIMAYSVVLVILLAGMWVYLCTALETIRWFGAFPDALRQWADAIVTRGAPWSRRAFGFRSYLSMEESLRAMLYWQPCLACWWGFACRRYLKLPHPWLVAVLLAVLMGLAGLVLQLWLVDHQLFAHW
ncbi:MAG: hypothetical protein KAS72_11730 [Phycisphaerales bacterium]|nr:hypothetical protein [Phycisphaerales bacterium]